MTILPNTIPNVPPKYTDWRPDQWEAVLWAVGGSEKVSLLDAPTGVGKSLIAVSGGGLTGRKTVYLTRTKDLQAQLQRDFPEIKIIMGRNNYKCRRYPKFPALTAADCSHRKEHPCPHKYKDCPYEVAKKAALRAPLSTLNMTYFLLEANYAHEFDEVPLLVVDEVDGAEDSLLDFISLVITRKQVDKYDLGLPALKTKWESWQEWATLALKKVNSRLVDIEMALAYHDEWDHYDFALHRERRDLDRLAHKMTIFSEDVDKNWVMYADDHTGRWEFKPVWVSKFGEDTLWKHGKKVLGMSATILDGKQMSADLGIGKDFRYTRMDCPFPVGNRLIYYRPVANVVNKEVKFAYPRLAKGLEQVMAEHPGENILVHTVGYPLAQYLKDHIPSPRVLIHTGQTRMEVLEQFRKSRQGLVLISPSMERGVSLEGDACTVVVVAKMMYPNLGDPRVAKRLYSGGRDGQRWYAMRTAQSVVQSTGRHIRSSEEKGVSYILDEQFERFEAANGQLFPKWWMDAVRS